MTKISIGAGHRSGRAGAPEAERARRIGRADVPDLDTPDPDRRDVPDGADRAGLGAVEGVVCDLYGPGHQIHYTHQADAVHSPSRTTRRAALDGPRLTLVLDDGETLRWRHHDPERLERIIELLRGRCVVYREHHALRVGPYWFNCATEDDAWQECRRTPGHSSGAAATDAR
jgi:hypothetical protein